VNAKVAIAVMEGKASPSYRVAEAVKLLQLDLVARNLTLMFPDLHLNMKPVVNKPKTNVRHLINSVNQQCQSTLSILIINRIIRLPSRT
jgi:hypothetical protein